MTEHLAGVFGSAVGMLASSQARSFELFTEVTNLTNPRVTHGWKDPLR